MSSFTVLVTVVLFPALSVATTVMVLVPSVRVITLDQEPSEATVAASALPLFNLTVTDTGLDVASFVVPRTVQEAWLVTRPSVGDVTESVGGTVSILNETLFCAAAFPS